MWFTLHINLCSFLGFALFMTQRTQHLLVLMPKISIYFYFWYWAANIGSHSARSRKAYSSLLSHWQLSSSSDGIPTKGISWIPRYEAVLMFLQEWEEASLGMLWGQGCSEAGNVVRLGMRWGWGCGEASSKPCTAQPSPLCTPELHTWAAVDSACVYWLRTLPVYPSPLVWSRGILYLWFCGSYPHEKICRVRMVGWLLCKCCGSVLQRHQHWLTLMAVSCHKGRGCLCAIRLRNDEDLVDPVGCESRQWVLLSKCEKNESGNRQGMSFHLIRSPLLTISSRRLLSRMLKKKVPHLS